MSDFPNHGWMERFQTLVNGDEFLQRIGRHFSAEVLLEFGSQGWVLSIHRGRIEGISSAGMMRPWAFAIRGPVAAWQRFLQPFPPPFYHDLFALTKAGHMVLEGDIRQVMMNLRALKALLGAMRRLQQQEGG